MRISCWFAFGLMVLLGLGSGCTSAQSGRGVGEVGTPVERWVASAPKPEAVSSSLDGATAPEAVATFNALSENVSRVYKEVYDGVRTLQIEEGEGALPLSDVARASAQAGITNDYRRLVQEIAVQRQALSAWLRQLQDGAEVAHLPSREQQLRFRVHVGQDAQELARRLQLASAGATLLQEARFNATLKP